MPELYIAFVQVVKRCMTAVSFVEGDDCNIIVPCQFFGNDCSHPLYSADGKNAVYYEANTFHS